MKARITLGIAGALIALTASFIAFGGTPGAEAIQGQAVKAGESNIEDSGTILCLAATDVCGNRPDTALTGRTDKTNGVGVYGQGDTGVSGLGSVNGGTGVIGLNVTSFGIGVHGVAIGTGSAVYGEMTGAGVGVFGDTTNGTGVWARSTNGTALNVTGKATFSRSGTVTIAYPNKTATVSGVPVTAKSLAFATMQKFLAGRYVVAVVPNLSGSSNSITIHLNKAPGTSTIPKSVVVGWQVIEKP
jgi:hypothetical protein